MRMKCLPPQTLPPASQNQSRLTRSKAEICFPPHSRSPLSPTFHSWPACLTTTTRSRSTCSSWPPSPARARRPWSPRTSPSRHTPPSSRPCWATPTPAPDPGPGPRPSPCSPAQEFLLHCFRNIHFLLPERRGLPPRHHLVGYHKSLKIEHDT